jgi:Fibronectin type III domain
VAHTMLARLKTMARRKRPLALASLFVTVATLVASTAARAQTTTTTTGPIVAPPTPGYVPDRIDAKGNDIGTSTRSQNLNPLGINYADCAANQSLRFNVNLSGFNGTNDSFQIWATNSGDCTANAARGVTVAPTCWLLYQQAGINVGTTQSFPFTINVRDIVGSQGQVPDPASVAATQANGQARGLGACTTQPSFSAVPISIWFLAVDSTNTMAGTPYQYGSSATPFTVDLLGPPAPIGVGEAVGDTLFIASWTPNADSDTVGYDIFIDPIPGQEGTTVAATDASVLYCPPAATQDAGSTQADDSGVSADDGGDAAGAAVTNDGEAVDATAITASTTDMDAADACFYINSGGPPPTNGVGTCEDPVLSSAFVQEGGTTTTDVFDEAGDLIDASTTTGGGGLSNIPAAYLYAPSSDGVTIPSNATGTFTITGLKNGTTYNVVVAAVDGSGNVGPPSAEVCDYPAPVNDFWNLYRNAGGRAGGGLCALEAVGEPVQAAAGVAMFVGTGLLAARRRRSRRGRGEAGSQAAQREPRR